ncbi:MAG: hypothetical protein IJ581_01380 [Paludibacteraceae bacterium]|nr:hypothetical protein [Paludibacteraceae bacterium]
MLNKKLIIASMTMACMFTMTSCFGPRKMTQRVVPTAVNTINSVGLSELNLKHGTDYTIVNTVTAEATVLYREQKKGTKITIKEENNEFEITFEFDSEQERWYRTDFEGIARFGFFSNDDYYQNYSMIYPENVVRNLAMYRIINQAKVRGADGIIEPVVSTNVEQQGKDIVFKTTATAKLIKLKTDAK